MVEELPLPGCREVWGGEGVLLSEDGVGSGKGEGAGQGARLHRVLQDEAHQRGEVLGGALEGGGGTQAAL